MFAFIILSEAEDRGIEKRFPRSYKGSPIILLTLALVLLMVAVFVIAPIFMRGINLNETSPRAVSITITSNPSGSGFVNVDGVNVTTPIVETWSPSSIHQLEALSPILGPSGVRYEWTEWSDNGSENQSYKVPDASQTVTATYTAQYQVTFSVNATEGVISPSGRSWYNAAAVVPISTIANPGYSFASWTESGSIFISNTSSASTNATINGPGTVTANFASSIKGTKSPTTPTAGPNVLITISSNPSGSGLVEVDGTMQVTPYLVSWPVGSTHTLEALSNVENGTGVQYVWVDWSNGATQLNTYTVPSSSATITADYKTQYLLTVKTNGLPPPYATAVSVGAQQIGKANDATPITEWLDASSSTGTIGIDDTVIPGATGTRYVFTNWTPDDSSANPRSSTTITSPLTLTANYNTQYQVTFSANPSDGGTTTPLAGTGWYNAQSRLEISAAAANIENEFASWTVTGNITIASASSTSTTATIKGSGTITANFQSTIVYITINSIPYNLPHIIVDGQYYNPQTFTFIIGTNHTIGAPSPVSMGTGTQYVFSSWSNGAAQNQTYIVPDYNATLTVTYTVQYYLTVNSSGKGTASGSNWYNAGSTASFSITPATVNGSTGTRYTFKSWTGAGSGSYSGSASSRTVIMNNPISETANWNTQYQLTTSTNYGTVSPASGTWYNAGSPVTIYAVSPSVAKGERYSWNGWTGSGNGSYTGKSNDTSLVTMHAPITETASWTTQYLVTFTQSGLDSSTASGTVLTVNGTNVGYAGLPYAVWVNSGDSLVYSYNSTVASVTTSKQLELATVNAKSPLADITSAETVTATYTTQYYLTVSSSHGSPTGQGWYNSGSSASFGVTTPASGGTGTQYVFKSWSGSGSGSYSGTSSSHSVTMNNPITETASWTTQYYLTVNSAYGGATGQGWYNSGSSASFGVTTPASGGNGTRYVFKSWSGSGSGSYSGTRSFHSVTMNNPITETASWTTQYLVTFTQSGLDSSTASGTVLTVNGTNVGYSGLPYNSTWVNSGDSVVYSYNSTVASLTAGKQFELTNVTVNLTNVAINPEPPLTNITSAVTVNATYTDPQCLVTGNTGLVSPITAPGTDTATYTTQYQVTFAVSHQKAEQQVPQDLTSGKMQGNGS